MMDNPDLSARLSQLRVRHMTLLDRVLECGSLSKVAQSLHMTQPAVTAMLQELEGALGMRLVERGRQGARLTQTGQAARLRLRQVLNALHGLESAAGMASATHHLRVAVLTGAMLKLVPDAIARLHNSGPGMTFQFFEDSVENVVAGVLDGKFDCCIGRIGKGVLQSANAARLAITQLHEVPLKIIAASDHPLCALRRVPLSRLRQESWVLLPPDSQSRQAFDHAFIQQGYVPPLPVVESLSFYSNFHLVSRTRLLTIAPETSLTHFAAANIVRGVRIKWPIGLSPLMFFCLKENARDPAIQAFRRALRAEDEKRKEQGG